MEKFFKIIYYVFFTLLVVLGLLLVTSYFGIGGVSVKIVQSGSMEPSIKVGSIVVVRPTTDYNTGDVITFGEDTQKEVPTTHRIVDERIVGGEVLYSTKGDANDDVDPQEVSKDEVIGKVIFSIPILGYILDFARKPVGFVLLIGVPALLVVSDEVMSIWKEVRKMQAKKKEKEVEFFETNEGTKTD
ncbi:MAG: signal peptidase I [Minisyncoccota bacterium]